MNNKLFVIVISLIQLFLLFITGCNSFNNTGNNTNIKSGLKEKKIAGTGKGVVIAEVNGDKVTDVDIHRYFISLSGEDRFAIQSASDREKKLINKYIDELLLYQEAVKEELKNDFHTREIYNIKLFYKLIRNDFEPSYKEKIEKQITEDAIKNYYQEKLLPLISTKEGVEIVQVFTRDKNKVPDCLAKIKSTMKTKNPKTLRDLAKELSEKSDKTYQKGGRWGTVFVSDIRAFYPKQIVNAVERYLKIEKNIESPYLYPEVLKIDDGFHILIFVDKSSAIAPPYESARDAARIQLFEKTREDELNNYTKLISKNYKIEINDKLWNDIQPAFDNYLKVDEKN